MNVKRQSNPGGAASTDMCRRDVLKWIAALGGASALSLGAPVSLGLRPAEAASPRYGEGERMFHSGCTVNCGSQCVLRAFVKGGRVTRVESDNSADSPDNRAIRACARGRSMRQVVYSPDRIKYPMRRVAGTRRGEGKFERISWDEAIETIAREWVRVLKEYGPEAVYRKYGSGTISSGITWRCNEWYRLANMLGGSLQEYGTYSTAQINAAMPYLYGANQGNTINDMEHSRLIVLFGSNILETRQSGGGLSYELFEARNKGNARVIVIDPRYSDTVAKLADQWVPVRPGSDAALVAGMAHVMITEGLMDTEFVNTHCLGFDEEHMPEGVPEGQSYKAYIMGQGPDGLVKTPQWAAGITGCPPEIIVRLAREIAVTKPCCVLQGWGPQRHANGDAITRAIPMLAIMTGNVGVPGGGTGSSESISEIPFPRLPIGVNPVKTTISFYTWEAAINTPEKVTATAYGLRGKDKLSTGIKFLWNNSGNSLINQHSDTNGTRKTLEDDSKCEFLVVVETRMTSSAMFADIILPSVTPLEQDDIIRQGYQTDQGSLLIARKAIEPLFEARTQYDICVALAKAIGRLFNQPDLADRYSEGRSQLDWVKYLYAEARKMKPELPVDFEEASRTGVYTWFPLPQKVAFRDFHDDPVGHPLKTPSGKIEVFSKRLWELNHTWELPKDESISAIPAHVATWEGPEDHEGMKKYPFQLIGHHFKGRTHSSYGNVPWLMQVAPQQLWMNELDAKRRGIRHNDMVMVFNDRGAVRVRVKVTPRIMPGVLSLPQGAWYQPGKDGVDNGACVNTLTRTHMTPLAKGNPQHTNLVDVVRADSF